MSRTLLLFQRYYFDRQGFIDGTSEFHTMCSEALGGASQILEIGAGPSNATTRFLSTIAPVIGVDVSPEVLSNDAVAEARVYEGEAIPFADASFDGCVSNYVLEHVENSHRHFAEVSRVLRPGAPYLFRTPNNFHYVAFVSRILPQVAHVRLSKRLRGMTSEDHDPWPTFYRANSPRTVRRLAREAGLEVVELRMVEKEPSYGRVGAAVFYPMMFYERMANAFQVLAPMRANIFGILRRPGSSGDAMACGLAR